MRRSVVTQTYEVEVRNETIEDETVFLDAEDDIVSAAVFVYQLEENFGDNAEFNLAVGRYGNTTHYTVNTPKEMYPDEFTELGDKYYGEVSVKVRASTFRM